MTSRTVAVLPRPLLRLVHASDQSTGGRPVLPEDTVEEALNWLRRVVLDFEALDTHIAFLQELYDVPFRYARMRRDRLAEERMDGAGGTHFRYHEPLTEERVLAILDGGPDVLRPTGENPHELPRLLLNPVALQELFDVINDVLPEHWLSDLQEVGKEKYLRETATPGISPGRPRRPRHWVGMAVGAAAILLFAGLAGITVFQINRARQLSDELARLREQQKLEDTSPRNDTKRDRPLLWTGDPANRPAGWDTLLKEHYDPEDSAAENLNRLEKLGGNKLRAEIAKMRQQKPDATAVEILDQLFEHWGPPKKR